MVLEKLNHVNPEYVTWKYEEIMFALLGGIRIEGLHSMRVTLKVDYKTYPSIRHSLDLYNETQTEKLCPCWYVTDKYTPRSGVLLPMLV